MTGPQVSAWYGTARNCTTRPRSAPATGTRNKPSALEIDPGAHDIHDRQEVVVVAELECLRSCVGRPGSKVRRVGKQRVAPSAGSVSSGSHTAPLLRPPSPVRGRSDRIRGPRTGPSSSFPRSAASQECRQGSRSGEGAAGHQQRAPAELSGGDLCEIRLGAGVGRWVRTCAVALEMAGDRAAVAMRAAEHRQRFGHWYVVSLGQSAGRYAKPEVRTPRSSCTGSAVAGCFRADATRRQTKINAALSRRVAQLDPGRARSPKGRQRYPCAWLGLQTTRLIVHPLFTFAGPSGNVTRVRSPHRKAAQTRALSEQGPAGVVPPGFTAGE